MNAAARVQILEKIKGTKVYFFNIQAFFIKGKADFTLQKKVEG